MPHHMDRAEGRKEMKCPNCGEELTDSDLAEGGCSACGKPTDAREEALAEIVNETMNKEAVRNKNPDGHKYSKFCSCERCHIASVIAHAISTTYINGLVKEIEKIVRETTLPMLNKKRSAKIAKAIVTYITGEEK